MVTKKSTGSLEGVLERLNKKYNNVSIQSATEGSDGSVTMSLLVDADKAKTTLENFSSAGIDVPPIPVVRNREQASSLVTRDALSNDWLDLKKADVLSDSAHNIYGRAIDYYKKEDVYGSLVDVLTNFSMAGFKNDIDDLNIRDFYDNWVVDSGFDEAVEQIFFEFFRTGFVRTYKLLGKYEPKVNYVSPIAGQAPTNPEKATLSKVPKSTEIPVKYTVLNPRMVVLEGAMFSDVQKTYLKKEAGKTIKEWFDTPSKDLTDTQKEFLKNLPKEMVKAIKAEEDIPLDQTQVGRVDYRTQPYEVYPMPRGARSFVSMEYKRDLRNADSSTLDGITNYILLITIGNDQYPVKSSDTLDEVASMFDTPAKSFDVVYNHTLKVQKIVSPEIGDILGPDKYKQVNEDITGSWGVIRAVIDGVGDYNSKAVDVAVKALEQEVGYARRQVTRWIYREYKSVAEAMGFNRYPKVRFDKMILKNEILMMNVIEGLIDRRALSYQTGLEELGFDYDTILSQLQQEKPLVLAGDLGIIGSPYNPKAVPMPGQNVQDIQGTPKGTPSEGRPKGKPAVTPKPASKPNDKVPDAASNLNDVIKHMSKDDLSDLITLLKKELSSKQ